MNHFKQVNTPIGNLTIVANEHAITHLFLTEEGFHEFLENESSMDDSESELLTQADIQLQEYFQGKRTTFDLPFEQSGTPFREKVWSVLQNIPYGQSYSYLDVAEKIGSPKAVRAVGQANKANKLPIFIPCHRVIGKNKGLTGYAGTQTDVKAKLLDLEKILYKN
ncbi:methylated-DNA--[protein]-cysteine S-methyltransferase [Metabacillus herbersteinensis]|uniref:Methylated-DNA--protein-cysteine methyltransferase n=1 Tax=Metabacillus herbersteinensis TaxID=283816 RepID=A0ABV6G9Y9_9BACI